MTDHTWGVDQSHYDPVGPTSQIVSEGFGFLTHKAGGDSNDPELNAWWNDAKPHRADILLGAYWVLYPGHGSGAADTFLARLDSQCPGWRDGPFILQLDCEEWGGDPGTMPGLSDIRACANRLRALMPKLMPIVYAPKWAYGNSLSGLGFPLWSSSYTTATGPASVIYPGDTYSGWDAYSGIVPSIAQFSSHGSVADDSTTDVNCFKGTSDQLKALLAPGWSIVATLDSDDKAWMTANLGPAATWAYPLVDPYDTNSPPRTVTSGGWVRYSASRNLVDPRLPSADGLAKAFTQFAAQPPATPDPVALAAALAAPLAAALNPLIEGVDVTPELIEQALSQMSFHAAVDSPPADGELPAFDTPKPVGADSWDPKAPLGHGAPGMASDTPIHDEAADAVTKQMRQERQTDINANTARD